MFKLTRAVYLLLFLAAAGLSGCASQSKFAHIEDDCERARAYYQEMQESVRLYYALGTSTVAEIAVAERKLKKAREAVIEACGEAPVSDIPDSSGVETN